MTWGAAIAMTVIAAAMLGGRGMAALRDNDSRVTTSTISPADQTVLTPPGVESAAHAFRRMLAAAEAGQFDHLWLDLDPMQRAAVPRDLFVRCETEAVKLLKGAQYMITRGPLVNRNPPPLPGSGIQRNTVMQVDFGLRTDGGEGGGYSASRFFALVDGRWTWSMDQLHVDAYRAGSCAAMDTPSF